ncbi:LOW QUALITY PROTEIN: hypothetical protein OSB04_017266 [Centaurea solstitialis]|uniref:Uncharacterized protein n=1 Tax=Centaurea solstitialis TaxID=347529 RepID=A0AA38WLV5_9ASTR|nr:LOW QUALITY PROTEIN: hypothetical protein OSB04_017266 [Centaurea solstitialis]
MGKSNRLYKLPCELVVKPGLRTGFVNDRIDDTIIMTYDDTVCYGSSVKNMRCLFTVAPFAVTISCLRDVRPNNFLFFILLLSYLNINCNTELVGVFKGMIDYKPDGHQEVRYSIYILHVLLPFLKRLNEEHLKEKPVEAKIQGIFHLSGLIDIKVHQIFKWYTDGQYDSKGCPQILKLKD